MLKLYTYVAMNVVLAQVLAIFFLTVIVITCSQFPLEIKVESY